MATIVSDTDHAAPAVATTVVLALSRLNRWIKGEQYCGWDPYDALSSPVVQRLTFDKALLTTAWVQIFKQSPLNLRPHLGVPKAYNPEGMGLFLASALRRYEGLGDQAAPAEVHFFAKWLEQNSLQGYSGPCWGHAFDWPNRGCFAPTGTPNTVTTASIALALLQGYNTRQGRARLRGNGLKIARQACDFVLHDLSREQPAADELCFAATPLDRRYVHNANLLGAQLLAEVFAHTREPALAEPALAAARYTARRQRPDGAWPSGEWPADRRVVSYHTGSVLISLRRIACCLNTTVLDESIRKGYQLWRDRMFLADGTPKYYLDALYPIDSHVVAQAILTFLAFQDRDPDALAWAGRVALWGIKQMQAEQGCFDYQLQRGYRNRIPYMRWSQAWMQRALVELQATLEVR